MWNPVEMRKKYGFFFCVGFFVKKKKEIFFSRTETRI